MSKWDSGWPLVRLTAEVRKHIDQCKILVLTDSNVIQYLEDCLPNGAAVGGLVRPIDDAITQDDLRRALRMAGLDDRFPVATDRMSLALKAQERGRDNG